MPAVNHFTDIRKGEDVPIAFTIRTGPTTSFPVVNITGWTFSFKIKRHLEDADPSLVTAAITITDALAGAVTVTIASAETQTLEGDYLHALWRTNPGAKNCLSEGLFTVRDTVES